MNFSEVHIKNKKKCVKIKKYPNFDSLKTFITTYTKQRTMKKILLTFGAAIALASTAKAQLALETFDAGGSTGSIPAGWVMQNDGHTVSTSLFGGGLPALVTALNTNAWYPVSGSSTGFGSASDYQMITTSYFSPAATADRWIMTPAFNVTDPNMVIQWEDNDLGSGEMMEVLVSPTASTTTSTYVSLYSAPADPSGLNAHQVSLAAYNGTSIRVAFRDHTNDNWGMLLDNVQTVILPSLDLSVTSVNLNPFVLTGSSNTISGMLHNYGVTTTTSMNLNYSVNGGAPVVSALSGLSVPLGSDYNYSSTTPWVPATAGSYTIKVWADMINGSGVDENNANDTMTVTVSVMDTLEPKIVMIEEFTQASCDPCANAAPNVDSVYANNTANALLVRYHVNWPGTDYMNNVTQTPFVGAMVSFYSVSGVPDAQLDGQYVYPGAGGLSSAVIHAANALMSPLKISVTGNYDGTSNTFSFSANIQSHGDLPSGLRARAVLAIDQLTYANNQSTESIPQYVFPEVAETMFGSGAAGTALSAFTAGSTQTFASSWVKNHRWASVSSATWNYDSTATGKIIVWVENDATKTVYQAAAVSVPVTIGTGVNAIVGENGKMDVYPNPATSEANIALDLSSAADVKLEVYNAAGQIVYNVPAQNRHAGSSQLSMDLTNFASGTYFAKVTVGNEVLTKKFTVAK